MRPQAFFLSTALMWLGIALATFPVPRAWGEEAPEATTIIFDLYVADAFRGDALVTYTDAQASFTNPLDVLPLLPPLKDEQQVLDFLTGTFPLEKAVPQTGSITVFPNEFRANITLAPEMLVASTLSGESLSGEAGKRFSFRQGFLAAGTTSFNGNRPDGSLQHKTTPSYGPYRLEWQGTATAGQGYEVTNLAAAYETRDITIKGGLLETPGQAFASSKEYTGLRFSNTPETLYDNPLLTAQTLEVYVPSRSQVTVYRSGRVIFSRTLDFGLQELDTRTFPQGSYEVEIVITDETGAETRERKFFTKSSQLVPRDRLAWSAEAGLLRDGVNMGETPVFQSELRFRTGNTADVGLSAYGSDNVLLVESSLRKILPSGRVETGISLSSNADSAVFGSLNFEDPWEIFWNMGAAKTLTGFGKTAGTGGPDMFEALSRKRLTLFLSASRLLGPVQTSFSMSYSKNGGQKTYTYGPKMRWPFYRSKEHNLELDAEWLRNPSESILNAFVRYAWRPIGGGTPWAYTTELGGTQRTGSSDSEIYLRNNLQRGESAPNTPGTRFMLVSDVAKTKPDFRSRTTVEVAHTGKNSRMRLSGQDNRNSVSSNQSLSLEAGADIIYVDGNLQTVPVTQGRSSLVLELTGTAADTPMKILLNGQHIATGYSGQTMVLPIPPFRAHKLTLEPEEKNSLVAYDPTPYEFSLYPGNVYHLPVEVRSSILLFGRLLDIAGTPMAWQRIQIGRNSTLTDQSGSFELEFTGKEMPFIKNLKAQCTVALPVLPPETQYFHSLGDLLCV